MRRYDDAHPDADRRAAVARMGAHGGRPGLGGEEGMTLIEAMIALTILSVGLLSLFALHQAAMTASQLSFRISEATFLAQDMIDQLNSAEYTREDDNAGAGEAFETSTDNTVPNDPFAEHEHWFDGANTAVGGLGAVGADGGNRMYTRTYDIEPLSGSTTGRVIVRARVSFRMKETGKDHGVNLITSRSYDRYEYP
jgi:type IV pilus modification protein PilV